MPVSLRELQGSDSPTLYAAIQESVPDLTYWMPGLHADLSPEDIQNYIAAQPSLRATGDLYSFAIVDGADSLLGGCGLSHLNQQHGFANVFYWVRAGRRGQGVAADAVRQLARFAFTEAGLRRVEIVVAVENAPSLRVAEKVGAVREGHLRNRIAIKDRVHDAILFSLIPTDLSLSA